jgi:hypothetical protein
LREQLERQIHKVPARINCGSIQVVREYKLAHKRAVKVLLKKNPTENELRVTLGSIT